MGMLKEFKEFALKGNLVDIAIAFVMGAAFSKLVSSFINGIVMPIVGLITAGADFGNLKIVLKPNIVDSAGNIVQNEVAISYGQFINVTIDFLLVSFIMFLIVKAINKSKKKAAEEPKKEPEPTNEEKLLMEIRDLLKNKEK